MWWVHSLLEMAVGATAILLYVERKSPKLPPKTNKKPRNKKKAGNDK